MAGFQNPLIMAFNQFMQSMRGQDPTAILNQMVSSGRINQRALDAAQSKVNDLAKQLDSIKKDFGK